ncbi:hypothetical protein JCM8097_001432 [Rhodosporidiobolus ruineniae]
MSAWPQPLSQATSSQAAPPTFSSAPDAPAAQPDRALSPSPSPPPSSDGDDDDDLDDTYGFPPFRPHGGDEDEEDGGASERGTGQGGRSKREKRPYFFPPLWLARRTACVEELRKEGVTSVADFGCGPGALLSLLALPAYHSDPFPSHSLLASLPPETAALLASLPAQPAQQKELHLRRLVGVDLSRAECEKAAASCKPASRRFGRPMAEEEGGEDDEEVSNETRWEDLRVEVYEGGVEVYNETLEGVEAMVLTEVVEHLTPEALARLPHLLFNVYKPRLVIVTTPNHLFNPYFPPPSTRASSLATEEDTAHLHPDPTLRTRRIFRDPTHLFEWTPREFRTWAEDAKGDDYDVSFSGVGSLAAYYGTVSPGGYHAVEVPFPPSAMHLHPALADEEEEGVKRPVEDPKKFWATQIAVFRRRGGSKERGEREGEEGTEEGEEERSPRSTRPAPLPFYAGHSPSPSRTLEAADLPPCSPSLLPSTTASVCASASTSSSPPKQERQTLVESFLLRAHPTAANALPSGASGEDDQAKEKQAKKHRANVLDALRRIFLDFYHPPSSSIPPSTAAADEEEEAGGATLSLADLWRYGTGPPSSSLRALVGGRVGGVVEAVAFSSSSSGAEGREWEVVLLGMDDDGVGGAGREKVGLEAVGVRWRGYGAALAVQREEGREGGGKGGGWAGYEGLAQAEEAEGREEEEEAEAPPAEVVDPGPALRETEQGGWSTWTAAGGGGWSAPLAIAADEGEEARENEAAARNGGWGDDPW